jgi:hypothetical protein
LEEKTTMKKVMGLVLALFLVVGTAGSAMAALGDFFLVAYEHADNALPIELSGNEAAVNFGAPGALDFIADFQNYDTGITLADFAVSNWSDVYVGVFGGGITPGFVPDSAYFGSGVTPNMGGNKDPFMYASIDMGFAGYDGGPMSDTNSYVNKMDVGGTSPTYNTLLQNIGEVQLVDGGAAWIDVYITPDGVGYTQLANWTLDTSSGSLVINPSAVPVPGAVLLFGTGLLGFFGIRRKQS